MDDVISRKAAIYAMMKLQTEDIEAYGASIPEGFDGDRAVTALKALPSAQRWIPCSERLPEDDVEVLVTDDAGGVQWLGVDKMMSYEDESGRFWLISQHPIAWMPLPEPYTEEKS